MKTRAVETALIVGGGSGMGQAAALNQDGTQNSSGHPASVGSTLTLFATGAGSQVVSVTVGGKSAAVLSTASATPGVLQLSVQIPAGVSAGSVPVVIQAGGISSAPAVTLSVR